MQMVEHQDELFDRVEEFLEGLELGTEQEIEKAREIVKKSETFLAVESEGVHIFVPSSFIGYKDLSILDFKLEKHLEKETNPILSKILNEEPKSNQTLDEFFLDFCDDIEINRNHVGLSRMYWLLKDI